MISILNPICRGIVGYISYLAACSGRPVYSEYLLYEPIMRIAQSKGYKVRCEYPVVKSTGGDYKRIDFDFKHPEKQRIGLELKWVKRLSLNLDKDIQKLHDHHNQTGAVECLLLFGKGEMIKKVKKPKGTKSVGKLVTWDSGKTCYAARWYRVI